MRRALLFVMAASACTVIDPVPPSTPVAITRLSTQPGSFLYYSQLRDPERLVVREEAEWAAVWASLWPTGAPISAPPQVDFTKDMIVLAALGERNTGGYSIRIDSARTTSGDLVVFIGTSSPGPHCATTQALTQPVDIARMPRTDVSVGFVDIDKVVDCQ